ncbi:MAG TPA: DUF2922 domain-containing protein [Bacillaceae bacterium]
MKTLELSFMTASGKTARISIENPVEPAEPAAVQAAMEEIIASSVFFDSEGALYESVKGARLVERNVTDIIIV